MTRDPTPKPCRECDYRREQRCAHYDRALSTMRREFDVPEVCYGRHVDGQPKPVWSQYEQYSAR